MTPLTVLWRLAPHRLRLSARRAQLGLLDLSHALRSERRAVAATGSQLRGLRTSPRLSAVPEAIARQPVDHARSKVSDAEREERRARARERRLQRARSASHEWPSAPRGVAHRVRYAASGATLTVDDGQSLLAAGLEAGLELSFSCALGGCGACKCKLAAGEVELREPNCLGDDERAAGLILPCVARPLSDVELEA